MNKQFELEGKRYKIAALLSDCVLFEYHIPSKTFYKFDRQGEILKDFDVIENFRYNKKLLSIIYRDDLERFYDFCNGLDSGTSKLRLDIRIIDTKGDYQWYQIKGQTLFDDLHEPYKVIGKISDIDIQRKEKEKLKERSERDPLTTLYNKEVTEKLITKLLKSEEDLCQGIFMLIDFDNFKKLNDTLGHLFGDSVLRDVSAQLRKTFRSSDILGRVGGDEFVIYISGKCNDEIIEQKTVEIQKIFDNIYTDKDKQLITSCSIGITLAPEHGTTYKELFKKADIALYQAKNNGKGIYQIFNELVMNKNIYNSMQLYNTYEARNEQIVAERLSVPEMVSPLFEMLYFSEDIKNAIQLILPMIGTEFNLCHIYINEINKHKQLIENLYEWVHENMELEPLNKSLSIESLSKYENLFNEEGVFYSNDITQLKLQSEFAFDYFNNRNVKSVLQCYIYDEGEIRGIVGFDISDKAHIWSKKELDYLITIARVIGAFSVMIQNKEYLKEEQLLIKEVSRNQKLLTYILKPATFELLDINEATKVLYPNAKPGELCYKAFNNKNAPCSACPLFNLSEGKTRSATDFYNSNKNIRLKVTATKIKYHEQNAVLVCSAEVNDIIEIIQGKDDLTGLPSLSKFERDANKLLVSNRRYAILSLDIDKFKNVNSNLGFQEGNHMLVNLVEVIITRLKQGELFCRSNADKFLLLLNYDNDSSVVARANQIFNTTINYLQTKYGDLHIVMAGGIYITDSNDKEISFAIDKANIARKSVKGSHRSIIANYDDKIHRRIMHEKQVESRMVAALNNNEFVVYFQPKIDLKTKKVVGAEALVRWKVAENKVIVPNEFIPIFEKNGFIKQMDFYIYEKVFQKMRDWSMKGYKTIPISINISRAHIEDKSFVSKMKNLVNRYNIPPNMVELEITESIFISERELLFEVLDKLKQIGFYLSIDDFGSGYSSLNLLRHLKMDVLKLDKDFFDQEKISPKESIVLANVIRMSKELGMIVLSEGVETKDQVEYLSSIGCDLAQGYFFARPMPVEEFEEYIHND